MDFSVCKFTFVFHFEHNARVQEHWHNEPTGEDLLLQSHTKNGNDAILVSWASRRDTIYFARGVIYCGNALFLVESGSLS